MKFIRVAYLFNFGWLVTSHTKPYGVEQAMGAVRALCICSSADSIAHDGIEMSDKVYLTGVDGFLNALSVLESL